MVHHLSAMWKFRHFLYSLVRLDLRLRYKRSVLGVGWSLLNPIAMTIVFTVVFSNLLGDGNYKSYAPFLLAGMAVWGFLRDSLVNGSRALLANEAYIRQSPLPYGLYPLRTVLGQAIHSAIALVVVVVLIVVLQQSFAAVAVLWAIIPGLVLLFLAAWAVATIAAFANVFFQDTQHLLEVGTQILFFLTPIMYHRKVLDGRGLGWIADLNPANLFLELIRAPLLTGQPPPADLFLWGILFTAATMGLAAGTVAWLQKKVIFHL